ncbi:hypothetical protein F3I62_18840 [Pseudomonas sp. R-28-1W-6]|uniref:hypothetical protein n=1 Tax=Pseudomonas sp. R-28-1W-6 TaxID=2650101 RepID=UPI001365D4FC|nr:hypothetical protein [Pseudomonas sp. R-28-1W-6]MWV14162.1 hypothetical protein [Pseudomonas sp. R-28-1W-6]
MDTQEELIKKQEEERKAAEAAQAALKKQLDDDNQARAEQIQKDQDKMRETMERQQESLKQSEQQAEEIRKRAEELNAPKLGGDEANPLEKYQEDMRKSAEQCAKLAEDSQLLNKQMEENQREQLRLSTEMQNPEHADDDLMQATMLEHQEALKKSAEEFKVQQEKNSRDFEIQAKLFDAKANGFEQTVDQQNKLLDEQQQKIQEDLQKQSQAQLAEISNSLEQHQGKIEQIEWDNSHLKGEDGKSLPNGQMFEDTLKQTGELNQRLATEEQKHGLHKPGEIETPATQPAGQIETPAQQPAAGEFEEPAKQKVDPNAVSNALAEGLPKESKGDMDGRHVMRPSSDQKLGEVQDNWHNHERKQRELVKEIRQHENDVAKYSKELEKSHEEFGDLVGKKPKNGASPSEMESFTAVQKQQEEMANKINHASAQGERKMGEFQRNEADFQRQSWDRVEQMAKFTGDKALQEKAALKSDELRQNVKSADEYLNKEFGPKQEQKQESQKEKFEVVSDGEAKNKHSPVSPSGISPEMVNKADEQVQDIEKARLERLEQPNERPDIKHKRN